jgi:hypothetical protein
MPYDVKKTGKDEYTVKKGGKTVGHTNKRNLRAYMGHLHSENKPKKKMKKEGIHDLNILSAPHTNVKTPDEKGVGYNPAAAAASLQKLANFGPKPKDKEKTTVKKENQEGMVGDLFLVTKTQPGCAQDNMVRPLDPLVGLGGSEIVPDQVHGVYHDKDIANSVAESLCAECMQQESLLEDKKSTVADKLKKAISKLQAQHKDHIKMATDLRMLLNTDSTSLR